MKGHWCLKSENSIDVSEVKKKKLYANEKERMLHGKGAMKESFKEGKRK